MFPSAQAEQIFWAGFYDELEKTAGKQSMLAGKIGNVAKGGAAHDYLMAQQLKKDIGRGLGQKPDSWRAINARPAQEAADQAVERNFNEGIEGMRKGDKRLLSRNWANGHVELNAKMGGAPERVFNKHYGSPLPMTREDGTMTDKLRPFVKRPGR